MQLRISSSWDVRVAVFKSGKSAVNRLQEIGLFGSLWRNSELGFDRTLAAAYKCNRVGTTLVWHFLRVLEQWFRLIHELGGNTQHSLEVATAWPYRLKSDHEEVLLGGELLKKLRKMVERFYR